MQVVWLFFKVRVKHFNLRYFFNPFYHCNSVISELSIFISYCMYSTEDVTDHAGPRRRCEFHPGTNFWHPPVEVTQFWHPRSGFGAHFFVRPFLVSFIDEEAGEKYETKPLLGCQNWITSTGGCQNLVPGWHSQRRGPAWSVMYSYQPAHNFYFFV